MDLPVFERVWNDLEMRLPFEADLRRQRPEIPDANVWWPGPVRTGPTGRRDVLIHRGRLVSTNRLEVLLNGRRLRDCFAADRRRGRAVIRRTNEAGKPLMHLKPCECSPAMIDGVGGGPHFVYDLVRGTIEFVEHDADCKAPRYPSCGCERLEVTP